jgi:hypothetical protein
VTGTWPIKRFPVWWLRHGWQTGIGSAVLRSPPAGFLPGDYPSGSLPIVEKTFPRAYVVFCREQIHPMNNHHHIVMLSKQE